MTVLNYDAEGKPFAPENVTIRREAFPAVYQIIRAVEERTKGVKKNDPIQASKGRAESC